MHRSFKFLLRPTSKQVDALTAMLNDHRDLYNAALQERRDAWATHRYKAGYYTQCAQLAAIRAFDPSQARWSSSSQQETLRRIERAFQDYFRRVQAGQVPGHPRYKGQGRFNTVTWKRDGDGCRWTVALGRGTTRVYLKGVGHVKALQDRPLQGRIRTVSVSRQGRRWYVILCCDNIPVQPGPRTGRVAGVDLGVAWHLSTSDGEQTVNPRHQSQFTEKLATTQRQLSRCKRGSGRRQKVRQRLVAIHGKVRRRRLDHAHKTARWLVDSYELIVHEDLRIHNLTRRPAPRADEAGGFLPNGASAKAGLNRAILDAGWGIFLDVLADKAESAGRELVKVNPAGTSQRCAACGHVARENRVSQSMFRCQSCGHEAHADVNAAKNILRAGLALRDAAA